MNEPESSNPSENNPDVLRKLPKSFHYTGDGWKDNPRIMSEVKRTGNVAIYSRTIEKTGRIEAYEVVKIRVAKAEVVFGRQFPDREVYPRANDFPTYGAFVMDLDRANEIFWKWVNWFEQQ